MFSELGPADQNAKRASQSTKVNRIFYPNLKKRDAGSPSGADTAGAAAAGAATTALQLAGETVGGRDPPPR